MYSFTFITFFADAITKIQHSKYALCRAKVKNANLETSLCKSFRRRGHLKSTGVLLFIPVSGV